MGGTSLNPLGAGREFNASLLKNKGKLLSLLYNYGIMGMGWLFFSHWVLKWTSDDAFLTVIFFYH